MKAGSGRSSGVVWTLPLAGGTPSKLASNGNPIGTITVNGDYVCYGAAASAACKHKGTLKSYSHTSYEARTVAIDSASGHVLWTSQTGRSICMNGLGGLGSCTAVVTETLRSKRIRDREALAAFPQVAVSFGGMQPSRAAVVLSSFLAVPSALAATAAWALLPHPYAAAVKREGAIATFPTPPGIAHSSHDAAAVARHAGRRPRLEVAPRDHRRRGPRDDLRSAWPIFVRCARSSPPRPSSPRCSARSTDPRTARRSLIARGNRAGRCAKR